MTLFIAILFIVSGSQADFPRDSTAEVLNFRLNNSLISNAKAELKGEVFNQDLTDFTLCLRYNINLFQHGSYGITIFKASNPTTKEVFGLEMTEKWANRLEIRDKDGNEEYLWFLTEIKIRQWNTICIRRTMKNNSLRIWHNKKLVYAHNECIAIDNGIGSIFPGQVIEQSCFKGHWKMAKEDNMTKIVGACKKSFAEEYWCPVKMETEVFNIHVDTWGYCPLSCMNNALEKVIILNDEFKFSADTFNAMELGAMYEYPQDPTKGLRGSITEFYIWNLALERSQVDDFADCNEKSLPDSILHWDLSFWKTDGLSIGLEIESHFCERDETFRNIGFNELKNFKDAMKFCTSFGGSLVSPGTLEQEKNLWKMMTNGQNLKCKVKATWLSITDIQQESEYVDISQEFYDTIFDLRKIAGPPIPKETRGRWKPSDPNGGVAENCVGSMIDHGWIDMTCESLNCVACTLRANQVYSWRGLCSKTRFDNNYKLDHWPQRHGHYDFIGQYGGKIKWSDEYKGFVAESYEKEKDDSLIAVYNETQEYPLGLKKWFVLNDNCPGNGHIWLKLSGCEHNNFTCSDGGCISIIKRCDKIKDCDDNSDEMNCDKVVVDPNSYHREISPKARALNGSTNQKLEVGIELTGFRVLDINIEKEKIRVRFKLYMEWFDSRIKFINLRPYEASLLSIDDIEKLWLPKLIFEHTNEYTRTQRDEMLTVKAHGDNPLIVKDLTTLHEEVIYKGIWTKLSSKRLYNHYFTCHFDMTMFPFDRQSCQIIMKLVAQQKDFIQLIAKDGVLESYLDDKIKVVDEFIITKVTGQTQFNNTRLTLEINLKRSSKMINTIYLPTFVLMIIVQMTFYFPEDNFQVRATIVLSCLLILTTLLAGANAKLPPTPKITFLEIWMIFIVVLTFLDICLQTAFGYLTQKEKKNDAVRSRVQNIRIMTGEYEDANEKTFLTATNVNFYGGKIISPFIFILFTLGYFTYAMIDSFIEIN